ncbi:unnamed protein product, partial [Medioppia subpectinata]
MFKKLKEKIESVATDMSDNGADSDRTPGDRDVATIGRNLLSKTMANIGWGADGYKSDDSTASNGVAVVKHSVIDGTDHDMITFNDSVGADNGLKNSVNTNPTDVKELRRELADLHNHNKKLGSRVREVDVENHVLNRQITDVNEE